MIRLISALICLVIFCIVFLPVMLILFILKQYKPDTSVRAASVIVRGFLKLILFVAGTKVEAEGVENIPDEPVLFVGNHRSDFDILVSYTNIPQPVGFVAKKSMEKIPFVAWWMKLIACLFLDRENAREGLKTIKDAIEQIKNGTSVFIFPEGTRNRNADADIPMEFKEGSLKIAQKAKCRIVPVVIKDTERIFEAQKPLIKACKVRIKFLKHFYTEEIPAEYAKTPSAYLRELIAAELENMKND